VDNGKFGAAVLMVLGAFFGFEATVIYREETKDPEKTVPRAVFATVALLVVFWVLTSWAYIAYLGNGNVERVAVEHMGTMFNDTLMAVTNKTVMDIVSVFGMTSVFASQLAITNTAARYWYSLGVDGALPKVYGKAHPKHHSPYAAALTIGVVMIALMTIFYVVRPDAPDLVYPMFSGTGTFFITVNLFLVSIAVVAYFKKNKFEGVTAWQGTIAPIIAAICVAVVMVLSIVYFEALLCSSGWATYAFVAFVLIVFIGSFVYASYLQKNKPEVYERLGRNNPDVTK
jgi:amino acid transporter